jgi:hypothetical protein
MKLLAVAMIALTVASCRTAGTGSVVKDDPVVPGEQPVTSDQPVGLDVLDNVPVVTQIPLDANPASDWGFSSGDEYWLYSSRGRYMTFDENDFYAPYQNGGACAGRTEDPTSACSVKPSKVAQACQYIASLTLKALDEVEPEEYVKMKEKFGGSFSLFGWMNDGYSDKEHATPVWQGPFIWRGSAAAIQTNGACPADFKTVGGYVKWVSSVDKNGQCKTPSKGQYIALLKKAMSCLEQNNANQ